MLKRWFLILLALLLILSLAACDKEDPEPPAGDDGSETSDDGNGESSNEPVVAHSGTLLDGAITWEVYYGGKMVIKGSGAMPDFEQPNEQPWWAYGGTHSSERSDAEEGVVIVTSIVVEEGITEISEHAFENYQSLTTVTLPNSLTTLSFSCFSNCKKLKTINGGAGVVTIEEDAFKYCSALETIELSSALTEVGWNAFGSIRTQINESLKLHVIFTGTEAEWQAVTVSSGNETFQNAAITYVTE